MLMKKLKSFAIITALFCFTASLFAQPVTYSFSGFGGGLPSSVSKISAAGLAIAGASGDTTSQRIIVDDNDTDDDDYNYYDEPKVNNSKKAALITTYVVLGVIVVAGVVLGTVYMSNESAKCCESGANGFIDGCAESCGEDCAEGCTQAASEACAESMAGACDEACASSSDSVECTTSTLSSIFAGGLNILPVFIP